MITRRNRNGKGNDRLAGQLSALPPAEIHKKSSHKKARKSTKKGRKHF
jgi:hypothetical protein